MLDNNTYLNCETKKNWITNFMNKKILSVVVPVYNVEKYLDTCIKSIINQTYSNLEIILVDARKMILEEYVINMPKKIKELKLFIKKMKDYLKQGI